MKKTLYTMAVTFGLTIVHADDAMQTTPYIAPGVVEEMDIEIEQDAPKNMDTDARDIASDVVEEMDIETEQRNMDTDVSSYMEQDTQVYM